MRRARVLTVLGFGLLAAPFLGTTLPASAEGKLDMAVATASKEEITHHEVFPPSTAKVYIIYTVAAQKTSKVKAVWIAEKVDGMAENSKFSQGETTAGPGYMGVFSYPKPNPAWPAGSYRVELSVDGSLEKTVRFKITK